MFKKMLDRVKIKCDYPHMARARRCLVWKEEIMVTEGSERAAEAARKMLEDILMEAANRSLR